jgi:hypothetical protein
MTYDEFGLNPKVEKKRRARRAILDGQKAPASESGRSNGERKKAA